MRLFCYVLATMIILYKTMRICYMKKPATACIFELINLLTKLIT
jgi:hypothetical protein